MPCGEREQLVPYGRLGGCSYIRRKMIPQSREMAAERDFIGHAYRDWIASRISPAFSGETKAEMISKPNS
jgi:hypothetical protein